MRSDRDCISTVEHRYGMTVDRCEDQLRSRRDYWGSMAGSATTHERLIPITSVVQTPERLAWASSRMEAHITRGPAHAHALGRAGPPRDGLGGRRESRFPSLPLSALAILHESESGTPLKVNRIHSGVRLKGEGHARGGDLMSAVGEGEKRRRLI